MKRIIFMFFLVMLLSGCGSDSGNSDQSDSTGGELDAGCNISAEKAALLAAHNTARSSARVCGADSMAAAPALAWNCQLEDAAQGHSEDMAQQNFFNHTGSNGLSASDRITNAGYEWRASGENIAAGQPGVDDVMQSWLNSPGHCRNIMNPVFTQMGAGIAESPGSQFGIYWTTNFATPR